LARRSTGPSPLPTREELLAFIEESPGPVGKREIARAFRLRGPDRVLLKDMLRDLADEGLIERGHRRKVRRPGQLPPVAVIEVIGVDEDGEPLARPLSWPEEETPPRIRLLPDRRARSAPATGDRILARLTRLGDGDYEARAIRRLPRGPARVLGVYRRTPRGARIEPTDRRVKTAFAVVGGDETGLRSGDLVLAETLPGRRLGLPEARIKERLGGSLAEPGAISLIAIHAREIPTEFSPAARAEARKARPVTAPAGRADLTALPLVTIDGADARDFDDAVWAEPDPERDAGWHAVVAIADVAHYVRPGSALDRAARERGNSVYFPDRVVPMLPEELSNDLCSLKPGEMRPCLAVHLWIDARGRLTRHRFVRALMRSAARLTYGQVQAARGGAPDETTGPLAETVIAPLYGVFEALLRARKRRGSIDLELPEYQVIFDDKGHVEAIRPRQRLDSHRLIEELMIAANVAAAETLEVAREAVMYRVHDRPSPEKIADLRSFLAGLGHKLTVRDGVRPADFAALLDNVRDRPHAPAVNTAILRSQAQAIYSPLNLGHFGLGLKRYSHFTSPIRRYADLLVHRALIRALDLGEGGLEPGSEAEFDALGEHLSMTERRAAAAERDAVERYVALYMAERVGATFTGRISGVARFGVFVALDETGAEGIVPRSRLADDFIHDEEGQRLVGPEIALRLGDAVKVRLVEAEVATGGLMFDLLDGGSPPGPRPPKAQRGNRPAHAPGRGRGRRGRRR